MLVFWLIALISRKGYVIFLKTKKLCIKFQASGEKHGYMSDGLLQCICIIFYIPRCVFFIINHMPAF